MKSLEALTQKMRDRGSMLVNRINTLYLTGDEYDVSRELSELLEMSPSERDDWAYEWLLDEGIEILGSPYVSFCNYSSHNNPKEAWIQNVRYK